jgi:hypothetical protein
VSVTAGELGFKLICAVCGHPAEPYDVVKAKVRGTAGYIAHRACIESEQLYPPFDETTYRKLLGI